MIDFSEYPAIESYGLIGNCRTCALIQKEGAIEFMSFPEFDSHSVFGSILDRNKGGYFVTKPQGDFTKCFQEYVLDTSVLTTRFLSETYTVAFTDFMPIGIGKEVPNQLIRKIEVIRGSVNFDLDIKVQLNYGKVSTETQITDNHTLSFTNKNFDKGLKFSASVPLVAEGNTINEFQLKEGEQAYFIIESDSEKESYTFDSHGEETIANKLEETLQFWKNWIKTCTYKGDFAQHMKRSAITLKLLTSSKYGAPIAAPTYALPETLGGDKNWDYRYVWIRDAAFTMYAFMRLGFINEASDFMKWVYERIDADINGDVELQIMYRLDGGRDLDEEELDFAGYKESKPVRIGNAATGQLQLDVFGELMDTIYLFDKYGQQVMYSFWKNVEKLIDFVCENWESPDHGIWEGREVKRHYLYSRLMCWVALDRAIRLVRKRSLPTDVTKWIENRNLIFKDIYDNFWDEELQSYVHFKGAKTVDSSLLMMPLMKFISPYDKRWLKTRKVIEEQLIIDEVLVYRNLHDSIPVKNENREGSFTIGSFWYLECLSRGGEVEKASRYFQKLMSYSNHLNLFSEELDLSGAHLGNFPQGFSHLGLISALFSIDRQKGSNKLVLKG